jgi:hypothetical protein
MHAGHYIAYNIHQTVTKQVTSRETSFQELQHYGSMIGLAVGKKAVASGPDMETISGEDVMQAYFRDDLGFESESPLSAIPFTLHITPH